MLANEIVSVLVAYQNCVKSNNKEWEERHAERLKKLLDELPHGSGIDGTWTADTINSNQNRLILYCSYHHMDENGMYDGWTDFTVRVTPSLLFGFNVKVMGGFPRKYSDTREYLAEMLDASLREVVK